MNKRGVALILSYMVIGVLTVFGSIFVSRSVTESNIARRYLNSTRALWIAEAGLAEGYNNQVSTGGISFGDGTYQITITDTSSGREIKSTANYGSAQRVVKGYFLRIPFPFENTLSVGGNFSLTGVKAKTDVYGKTRISGVYSESSGATGWFEDKQEGVSSVYTTIRIPDKNNNGTDDEFDDFILFGREAVTSYPPGQVVYLQTDGTVNIYPNSNLINKKVVFVEGSEPGKGDVNIFFDGTWQEGEDLTIISTGSVTYVQPLQVQENARLSIATWEQYHEVSIFRSEHESIIYVHDDANFVDILEWGSTTGNLIVNNDLSLREVLTYEKYYFSERAKNGDLPPGFLYLCGGNGILTNKLVRWQEE